MTNKEERFCYEYLIDLNATQAAIRAGYSPRTAKTTACEKMKKPYIKKSIEEALSKKNSELIATQEEVLETLTRILRREEDEHIVVTAKKRKSYVDSKTGKKVVDDKEEAEVVPMPPKLGDVNKAAELLGKRYGLYTDKMQVDGEVGMRIVDDIPSDKAEE